MRWVVLNLNLLLWLQDFAVKPEDIKSQYNTSSLSLHELSASQKVDTRPRPRNSSQAKAVKRPQLLNLVCLSPPQGLNWLRPRAVHYWEAGVWTRLGWLQMGKQCRWTYLPSHQACPALPCLALLFDFHYLTLTFWLQSPATADLSLLTCFGTHTLLLGLIVCLSW